MIKQLIYGISLCGLFAVVPTSGYTQNSAQDDATAGGPTEASQKAKVRFINLKNGQTVPNGTVIDFGLSGMGVAPAGVEKENTGHHHLLIDEAAKNLSGLDREIPNDENHLHFGGGQTEYRVDLKPGWHTLRLLLGDAKHVPHSRPVYSQLIRIQVVGDTPEPSPAPEALQVVTDCDGCQEMVVLPGATFTQGGKGSSETPRHQVRINSFAIAKYPITFAEWEKCYDDEACKLMPDDHGWGRKDRPVINVSWDDTQDYIKWLSEKTGKSYRLPTESEWEYAARAGTTTPYWWGTEVQLDQNANCKSCRGDGMEPMTVSVMEYEPNNFGLYDTLGNVSEWVEDCWHSSYKGNAPSNGSAWTKGGNCDQRVTKGGNYSSDDNAIRSASRWPFEQGVRHPSNGFRVARAVDDDEQGEVE